MANLEKVIRGIQHEASFGRGKCGHYCSEKDTVSCKYDKDGTCILHWAADALSLLKALEPQPPKHIHEEYPEHDWVREKDGSIDEFAMEGGFHNGPRCKRCNDSFCVHCEPDGYETHKPCIVDEDRCPKCGKELFSPWGKTQKITYCMDCGQAVKWDE